MKHRVVVLAVLTASLVACSAPDEPPARQGPRPEPVVVYASHDDAAYWPGLFAEFTRETGIRVTVKHGDGESIVADVIAKRGSPPADVLLAPNVAGIWRAADEGALLPLASEAVRTQVAERLRDPDGYWTAISQRSAEIVVDTDVVAAVELGQYEELSRPEYKGLLCLSSSQLSVNRSIIAMLIRKHGARPAEIIVRGWVANLAIPPLDTEAKLMQAMDAGTCALGIVSAPEARRHLAAGGDPRLARITPEPAYADVEAAGINRHAREPDAARRLVEWMLAPDFQKAHSDASAQQSVLDSSGASNGATIAAEDSVATIGAFDHDAVLLAERARYW